MSLFHRRENPSFPAFSPEQYEPVIRSSICTGEKTACMRDRETGRLREVILLRTDDDLNQFCHAYGLEPGQVRTVY